ncbi:MULTISPECIES: hypothetical protein [unclassified Mesorhizobium]|uniref:hypothetical protein n=1 Tax=unclassified Mesorhizobium TaxID=325217 RepID=UPI001673624E|nr:MULTISPECIES: hypothetical protein [unclassified Mesorhizobium]
MQRLDLGRWIDRPIADYSLGTRAKIAIVAALLGAPPLLIFDETLNGLDPVAAFEVKRVIVSPPQAAVTPSSSRPMWWRRCRRSATAPCCLPKAASAAPGMRGNWPKPRARPARSRKV